MGQLVRWVETLHPVLSRAEKYELVVGLKGRVKERIVATVWDNGVWATWDKNGCGGESSKEDSVLKAKIEAAASAIAQGFV